MKWTHWVAFVDVLICYVAVLIFMVNPEAVDAKSDVVAPGNVIVQIGWGKGDSDVDLWLSGPDEPVAVGYSNKNGVVWDLLRDDTGISVNDQEGIINSESAYSNGIPDGEYIVNIHAYGITESFPLSVQVQVIVNGGGSSSDTVFTGSVSFSAKGEEITVVRLKIKDGKVDHSSIHSVPIKLRSGDK